MRAERICSSAPASARSRARRVSMLGALVLLIAQGALAPAPASASRRRVQARSGEPVASISPPSGGEGAGTTGEGVRLPGESGTGSAPSAPAAGTGPPGEGRAGACRLQLAADPATLTAGETVALLGTLACAPSARGEGEQTVTVYQHSAGTPGFLLAGTAVSEAGGAFHFVSEALDASSVFYAVAAGARSPRVRVIVAPLVTISGPPAGAQLYVVRRRFAASAGPTSTITFTGAVTPEEAGGKVVLEREYGNEDWLRIGQGEVDAGGEYSITHTFGIPGEAHVRVLVHDHGHTGISETLTYQISRPQNERLTIQANTPSLTYGQAVTLSGVVNGGGRAALTLLASADDGPFAPVASAISEADGSYAFPSQTPLQDTWYRVLDGRAGSTMLLAGVKPLLAVQLSQASVEEGRPVTFTGTVTPARLGERVDLERQNGDGSGFHLVAQGTLDASGSFSIEHVLSGEGMQQLRVVVPGDRAMQTVTSAPFAVQATRPPLDAVLPPSSFAGLGS